MNWIDKHSQTNECAMIGNCKINHLLFALADDLVLLSSTESGFQQVLNEFAVACDNAGMNISTTKTEGSTTLDRKHIYTNPSSYPNPKAQFIIMFSDEEMMSFFDQVY